MPPVPSPTVRTRFAPSPTGFMHLGSARTALFNWLAARHAGGEMLLRIEDTDAERSQPEVIDMILGTLEWLGIDWDGEVVYQSQRAADHGAAVDSLFADGKAYWCACSRDDVDLRHKERGGKPGYDGFCRDRGLAAGADRVVRFRSPADGDTVIDDVIRGEVRFANADIEDFVIRRSNGSAMFITANAVDDIFMGITHIVRGEDLLPATPKIVLLRESLHAVDRPTFAHLPLIVNEKRQKLSKRRDDVALESYRDRGFLPEAMVNYLATLGWGPPDGVEVRPIAEIIGLFELSSVTKSSAFFDVKKLESFNGDHIRNLSAADFVSRTLPFVRTALLPVGADPASFDPAAFEAMAPLVQERVKRLDEAPDFVDFLYHDPAMDPDAWAKTMEKDADLARRMLDAAIDLLGALAVWEPVAINDAVIGFADANEISRKKAQGPIRVAITGRAVGPPLWEAMAVLGREVSLDRLGLARASVG